MNQKLNLSFLKKLKAFFSLTFMNFQYLHWEKKLQKSLKNYLLFKIV